MNETIAVFWILVLFTLRIGLPIVVTMALGNLWNARLKDG